MHALQFVPMTDELLYRAGGPPSRLVPYRVGLECWHALGADGVYRFDDEAANAATATLRHAPSDSRAPAIAPPLAPPA